MRAFLPRRRAHPTPVDVRASPPRRRARPTPLTCAPLTNMYALSLQACTSYFCRCVRPPSLQACTPCVDVCASLLACVRTLPRWRAHPLQTYAPPPCRHARPIPTCVHTFPTPMCTPSQTCAPCPHQCARPRRWWKEKMYKEGSLTTPLHHASGLSYRTSEGLFLDKTDGWTDCLGHYGFYVPDRVLFIGNLLFQILHYCSNFSYYCMSTWRLTV